MGDMGGLGFLLPFRAEELGRKSSGRPCLAKSKDRDEAKRVPQAKSWEGGAGERGREAVALAGEDEEVEDEGNVEERYAISGGNDNDDVAGELCEDEQEFEDDLAEELETRMAESSEDIWEDFEDEVEAQAGDGGDGGGFVLGEAAWAKTALLLAQEVLGLPKYKSDLSLFAFRVIPESKVIRARLDKLSDEYGSPTLEEIESFSRDFEGRLDQASEVPDDYALEVSSPGAERVVRVPQDLLRFMGLPMYVWYTEAPEGGTGASADKEEILDLVDLDEASETAVFRLADVRVNREKAGKGRGLTKKQKERRGFAKVESNRELSFRQMEHTSSKINNAQENQDTRIGVTESPGDGSSRPVGAGAHQDRQAGKLVLAKQDDTKAAFGQALVGEQEQSSSRIWQCTAAPSSSSALAHRGASLAPATGIPDPSPGARAAPPPAAAAPAAIAACPERLAFAGHPRIGDTSSVRQTHAATAELSEGEQQAALTAADPSLLQELAMWNQKYEDKFGHVFLICASGKSSSEVLSALKVRYESPPHAELAVAAREQQRITELRLAKLLDELVADQHSTRAAEGPAAERRMGQVHAHLSSVAARESPTPSSACTPGAQLLAGRPQESLRPPITTHVLDVSLGAPAVGVRVDLDREDDLAGYGSSTAAWLPVGSSMTDQDGCSGPLLEASGTVQPGTYRLTFHTKLYFLRTRTGEDRPFYPSVSVVFTIGQDQTSQHFHVPVLLAPYSYSTYRGS
eukprot:SM000017S02860  [mRNA]  locus=s17:683041:688852:+ [translate_table: standard]